ncbi:MAG: DUF2726 domain-containing protein [Deltaproteobacteria bacterium]|nr:DUF2726 domain-containing protein [Deltaproteobacteria bacterium]
MTELFVNAKENYGLIIAVVGLVILIFLYRRIKNKSAEDPAFAEQAAAEARRAKWAAIDAAQAAASVTPPPPSDADGGALPAEPKVDKKLAKKQAKEEAVARKAAEKEEAALRKAQAAARKAAEKEEAAALKAAEKEEAAALKAAEKEEAAARKSLGKDEQKALAAEKAAAKIAAKEAAKEAARAKALAKAAKKGGKVADAPPVGETEEPPPAQLPASPAPFPSQDLPAPQFAGAQPTFPPPAPPVIDPFVPPSAPVPPAPPIDHFVPPAPLPPPVPPVPMAPSAPSVPQDPAPSLPVQQVAAPQFAGQPAPPMPPAGFPPQQGPQPGSAQQGLQPVFPPQGPQPVFAQQGLQPGLESQGPQPGFAPQGPPTGFAPQAPQPDLAQQGPPLGFPPQGPQPDFAQLAPPAAPVPQAAPAGQASPDSAALHARAQARPAGGQGPVKKLGRFKALELRAVGVHADDGDAVAVSPSAPPAAAGPALAGPHDATVPAAAPDLAASAQEADLPPEPRVTQPGALPPPPSAEILRSRPPRAGGPEIAGRTQMAAPIQIDQTQMPRSSPVAREKKSVTIQDLDVAYEKLSFMTPLEIIYYKLLRGALKQYLVFPRVSARAVVKATSDEAEHLKIADNVLNGTSVSFIVCDVRLNIRAVVEVVDENIIPTNKDKARDYILKKAGCLLVRFYSGDRPPDVDSLRRQITGSM